MVWWADKPHSAPRAAGSTQPERGMGKPADEGYQSKQQLPVVVGSTRCSHYECLSSGRFIDLHIL